MCLLHEKYQRKMPFWRSSGDTMSHDGTNILGGDKQVLKAGPYVTIWLIQNWECNGWPWWLVDCWFIARFASVTTVPITSTRKAPRYCMKWLFKRLATNTRVWESCFSSAWRRSIGYSWFTRKYQIRSVMTVYLAIKRDFWSLEGILRKTENGIRTKCILKIRPTCIWLGNVMCR